MTNGERIRKMTDEELAEFLCGYDACAMCQNNDANVCYVSNCNEVTITEAWLKEEVGEEDDERRSNKIHRTTRIH